MVLVSSAEWQQGDPECCGSRGGRQHPKKEPSARVYFPSASLAPHREKVGEVSPTAAYHFNILCPPKRNPFDLYLNWVQLCRGVRWNVALSSYLMPAPLKKKDIILANLVNWFPPTRPPIKAIAINWRETFFFSLPDEKSFSTPSPRLIASYSGWIKPKSDSSSEETRLTEPKWG